MSDPTHFPILKPYGIDLKGRALPKFIRWSALSEEYARMNHGQSLAGLARRGGLDPTEALANIERRAWRPMLIEDALDALEPYVIHEAVNP